MGSLILCKETGCLSRKSHGRQCQYVKFYKPISYSWMIMPTARCFSVDRKGPETHLSQKTKPTRPLQLRYWSAVTCLDHGTHTQLPAGSRSPASAWLVASSLVKSPPFSIGEVCCWGWLWRMSELGLSCLLLRSSLRFLFICCPWPKVNRSCQYIIISMSYVATNSHDFCKI